MNPPSGVAAEISVERALDEKEEEMEESSISTSGTEVMVNGKSGHAPLVQTRSEGTQTMDCAPYEHLFLSVFPHLEQSSPAQSPAPIINNANASEWTLFPSKVTTANLLRESSKRLTYEFCKS